MRTPWYRDGLRFRCTQCGNCCTGAPGHVWVTRREIEELAKYRGLSVDEFGERFVRKVGARNSLNEKAEGDCVFFERSGGTGGCTVYSARPTQCRTFPFWRENLASRKAWEGVGEECPGLNQGRLYSAEDIGVIRKRKNDAAGK